MSGERGTSGQADGSSRALDAAPAAEGFAVDPSESGSGSSTPRPAPVATPAPPSFVCVGHDVLFGEETSNRCDVCGEVVVDDAEEGPAVAGRGLYVWARGEVVRREEPPLCPPCAAALALSALGRWEIEEEEG